MTENIQQLLPQSPDAEKALLSCLLIDRSKIAPIMEAGITPHHFHIPAHAAIFQTIIEQEAERKPTDIISLTNRMRDQGKLPEAGGPALISSLLSLLPTAENATHYAEIMLEKAMLRGIVATCSKHRARAFEEQDCVHEIISQLQADISEIAQSGLARNAPKSFKTLLLEKLDRIQNQQPDIDLIPTGILKLDRGSPLRLGDMPLIVGERKAGKSILSLTIAANIARENRILYFSLEDSSAKIIDRLFAGAARIPTSLHHENKMSVGDLNKVTGAIDKLAACKFTIRDDLYDLDKIAAASRQHKKAFPDLKIIVVDYAQLVRGNMRKNDTREREVATTSRTMRLLAMELNCALLLLSQLNSEGESRESRALEQDATACWQIETIVEEGEVKQRERTITIPWQRNGESGIYFTVLFEGELARVENLYEEQQPEPERKWHDDN